MNLKNIKYLKDISADLFLNFWLDNSFLVFKSINNIYYIIYGNRNKSIIAYDLINNQIINEIKNAHENNITNFKHYLDDNRIRRDLILSISASDNNIRLWNINNFECIVNMKCVYSNGLLFSACFLNDNNQNYIITSNDNLYYSEYIKVFDFNGNKIKEIKDFNFNTFYICSYKDKILSKNYILTGNYGYIKSYDYSMGKIYHKYIEDNDNDSRHTNLIVNDKNEIIKIIESNNDGYIRIWNLHSGELLDKIITNNNFLFCMYLWNNDFIFIGGEGGEIILIDINEKKVINKLIGHKSQVINIKKIEIPNLGECLISKSNGDEAFKLWVIGD